jgi:uncharacterized membrane protein YphA (DoxX/SURF4 family)
MNKALVNFSRIVVGVLFILSGLIKANDPLGFGYKLEEYFEVFHLLFLNNFAVPLAILLCTLEVVLGAALLFGIRSKQVITGLLLLIVFFTFLTFYSAAFDVVRSCGCFGDAIPLTPWQSFTKDLILLLLILVLFFNRHKITSIFTLKKAENTALWLSTLLALGFGLYTYNYMPVKDFLPYHKGANLPEYMTIPKGAPLDEYEINYTLKNQANGQTKQMTDKEYIKTEIWKDKNWKVFGTPENKLIKKGYEPRIKDLQIFDDTGTDYTAEIIENPYYNLVMVAYDLKNANKNAIGNLNALAINSAENYNIRSVLLTSASPEEAETFEKQNKLVMEVFHADGVPLKSMVRANPGLILLKDGVVIDKWHYHNLPSYQSLEDRYFKTTK